MARDMYLVGVSEDELKPDPKPEGPKTPKGKWDNYWYHYKWHTLGAIAVVVVCNIWGRGMIKIIPILLGVVGAYLVAVIANACGATVITDAATGAPAGT